ncbi:MAG: GTP-binding protein [Duncaniella sp.]|nr:GTP-binding protein [Duncaniella sp.]
MKHKVTPILLLTGYLGSGKTTLVNHILTNERGIKFAVIVNDIGEVNIDASLIQKGGIVDTKDDSLMALTNGCICCTLKMDLVKQIEDILKMDRFDYIVIEASGICEPAPIAQTICSIPNLGEGYKKYGLPVLDCIVTVVDAMRMRDEFSSGKALTSDNIDEEDIENLLIQQIEFCNIIVLNKVSEVTAAEKHDLINVIRALQPKAKIIETDYADVALEEIINTKAFDFEKVATSATWVREIEGLDKDEDEHEHDHEDDHHHQHDHDHHHDHEHGDDDHDDHSDCDHEHGVCHHHHHHHHHGEGEAEEYGIGTFVYFRRKAFDLNKFDYFAASQWPANIIRSKGVCYFSSNPDMSYLFEQAGRQKSLKEAGLWFATAPEEELMAMMQQDPSIMKDWDEKYGDRMIKIVFIGRNLDKEKITAQLDACLE